MLHHTVDFEDFGVILEGKNFFVGDSLAKKRDLALDGPYDKVRPHRDEDGPRYFTDWLEVRHFVGVGDADAYLALGSCHML